MANSFASSKQIPLYEANYSSFKIHRSQDSFPPYLFLRRLTVPLYMSNVPISMMVMPEPARDEPI